MVERGWYRSCYELQGAPLCQCPPSTNTHSCPQRPPACLWQRIPSDVTASSIYNVRPPHERQRSDQFWGRQCGAFREPTPGGARQLPWLDAGGSEVRQASYQAKCNCTVVVGEGRLASPQFCLWACGKWVMTRHLRLWRVRGTWKMKCVQPLKVMPLRTSRTSGTTHPTTRSHIPQDSNPESWSAILKCALEHRMYSCATWTLLTDIWGCHDGDNGVWRRVVWRECTDVSERCTASICRTVEWTTHTAEVNIIAVDKLWAIIVLVCGYVPPLYCCLVT